MNISRPACIGSTVEASKVQNNCKIFAFKKFILSHCLDSAMPPRPNERDPKSRGVKMHRKEKRKREEKGGKIQGSNRKKKNKSVRIDFSVVTPVP